MLSDQTGPLCKAGCHPVSRPGRQSASPKEEREGRANLTVDVKGGVAFHNLELDLF